MKKLFILFVLLISGFCSFAQTTVKIGEKITSADTVQVEVQLNVVRAGVTQLIYITVDASNSGTIQFAVGEVINEDNYPWPAGSKIPITIKNGKSNLRYKASAASQSFVITQ